MRVFDGYDFEVSIGAASPEPQVSSSATSSRSATPLPDPVLENIRPHRWTSEEVEVLCILDRWFKSADSSKPGELSSKDRRLVFCSYFSKELRDGASTHNFSEKSISNQLWEMKMRSRYDEIGKMIYQDTAFGDPQGRWSMQRKSLRRAAAVAGVDLVGKTLKEDAAALRKTEASLKKTKRKRQLMDSGDSDDDFDDFDSESDDLSPTENDPSLLQQLPHAPTSTPRKRRGIKQGINKRLGFRFFDDTSQGINGPEGFRAGAFLHNPIPPLKEADKVIEIGAKIHIPPLALPSPFISLFHSFLPALHRALRSEANAHIAIFDLDCIAADTTYGAQRVFPASFLARKFEIMGSLNAKEGKDYKYFNRGESLVYGEIPKRAILAVFSIADFRAHLSTHSDLNRTLSIPGILTSRNASAYKRVVKRAKVPENEETGRAIGR